MINLLLGTKPPNMLLQKSSLFKLRSRVTSISCSPLPMFNFSTEVDPSSIRVNKFHSGLCMLPHPAKREKGGEDAASVTDNLIALADGVGGWSH